MSIKFVIEYKLTHEHVVRVGINAGNEVQAVELAQKMMDEGKLRNNTPEAPLLMDSLDEVEGQSLDFNVVDICSGSFPPPDDSVAAGNEQRMAMRACEQLVRTYSKGERDGGIDWEDLDQVYELAKLALGKRVAECEVEDDDEEGEDE